MYYFVALFCIFICGNELTLFFYKKHPLLEYILLMTILAGRINFVRKE